MRNDTLFRIALREAKHCDDEETLLDVMFPHAKRCIPPYPENRLTTIVRSAWSIEVDPDKENWVGGPARAVLSALELEMLEGNSDAALLLMKFRAAHGWRGSGQFFIANAMRLSLLDGGKPWTLRRFTAARDALERLGFLVCLHRPGENGLPGAYRFNTPQPQAA